MRSSSGTTISSSSTCPPSTGSGSGSPTAREVRIGEQLEIIPDYHDTTTFRHDAFVGLRDGVVETIIPLLARGKLS